MGGEFILLGLAVLAIPVAVVVLLFGFASLRRRVGELERNLAGLERTLSLVAQDVARPAPEAAPPRPVEPKLPEADLAAVSPWTRVAAPAEDAVPEAAPKAPSDQNQPIVMRPDRLAALWRWLGQNWIYAVSGLSLAFAGIFLVQYSVQNSLLPPWARVVSGLLFGAALVGAGEWVRRRRGDGEASDTAYIPSIFSGAGIVSIFAATVAARQLYGLIGPEMALGGHVATAALAVGLGWYHGPLLVALGLLGGAVAPFVIASTAPPTALTYGYYGLIAVAGMAVDAVRRWAWVSVLALALGFGGAALMRLGGAGDAGWIALLVGLALASMAVPILRLVPDHPGPMVVQALLARGRGQWPGFPVRLVAGSVLVATLGLVALRGETAAAGLLAYGGLTLLALALLLWAERAPGLWDLALLPAVAIPLRIVLEETGFRPLLLAFWDANLDTRAPETAPSWIATQVLVMATLVTLAAAWRALRPGPQGVAFGLGAVLVAPVSAVALDQMWVPVGVLGPYGWALHVMALAALMVALALRFARADGDDHRRTAHATLSALSLIALSVFILTTDVGLTLALAVLVVVAAALDRRFRLPEMGWFIQAGVAALSWRLVVEPGMDWALDGPLGQVLLAFGGVILALGAALWLINGLGRLMATGVLESAALVLTAMLVSVLLARWLIDGSPDGLGNLQTHWGATLQALPWLLLALAQLYRARLGGPLVWLRRVVAAVAGLIATGGLLLAAMPLNPLTSWNRDWLGGLVQGPPLLDTLALAYAVPGLILLLAAGRLGLGSRARLALLAVGAALVALYAGLEIRRFWQGDWLGAEGVLQPELYTYTVALMLVGAGLLYQSIARRSVGLRRIGMAVIGVTIAKVFLIDAAGLTGLTRVFSFLGLGLSLAGLAWLNRWAGQAARDGG